MHFMLGPICKFLMKILESVHDVLNVLYTTDICLEDSI